MSEIIGCKDEKHKDEKTPLLNNPPPTPTSTPYTCNQYPSFNDTCDPQLGKIYPNENKSTYSNFFFSWLNPLLDFGNKRPIEADDLYLLNPEDRAKEVHDKFMYYWQKECFYERSNNKDTNNKGLKSKFRKSNNPSVALCLINAFGMPFLYAGFLKLIHDALLFVSPMVIQEVIHYLNSSSEDYTVGVYYTLVILISGVMRSFCIWHFHYYCCLTGMRLRSTFVTAIYQKSLRLSISARQRNSAGEITNLTSVDAQYLQDLPQFLHAIWYTLFQVITAIYLLWQQMGPSCLAGVAVICITIPLMGFITKFMKRLQSKRLKVKDERMKICYEIFSGIKIIKIQAWEDMYRDRVMLFRDRELSEWKKYLLTRSVFSTVSNALPSVVGAAVFATYVLVGKNSLDVSTALTSLSLLDILGFPLFMLPNALNSMIQANVSLTRIKKFLLEEEYDRVKQGSLEDVGILFKNAHFSYQSSSDDGIESTSVLRNVNVEMKDKGLYAIVGKVGSSKSSFINGLLGDAKCVDGEVFCRGSIALVSQQPFILNATLRDNILFGKPFNLSRYNEAIFVSALEPDLKIFPEGDNTEIGEKGVTLSGGQRSRIGIARAVYANADIYLFDDPLAAVDAHVGRHIFDECIIKQLQGKLRVLVTNAVTYLPQCDQILILENGAVAHCGTYNALLEEKHGILHDMVRSVSDTALTSYTNNSDNNDIHRSFSENTLVGHDNSCSKSSTDEEVIAKEHNKVTLKLNNKATSKLITTEDRATGDVPFVIYKLWFSAAFGMYLLCTLLILYLTIRCLDTTSTLWLSFWSEYATSDDEVTTYLSIYVLLKILYIIGVFAKFIYLYFCGLRASRKLFENLLDRVLHAPMNFFDTTPLGRITNRLSKDISTLDEEIPSTLDIFIRALLAIIFTLATIIYVTPLFAICLIPIFSMYYMSQRYFISTARELQRLDNISRSPVHALFSETLDGMTTIRAYEAESLFIQCNNDLLDANQRAYFLKFSTQSWLGLRLGFAGTLIATGATLFAVLNHGSSGIALFAGLAGVSISYAYTVTPMFSFMIQATSDLQTQMVSVERVKKYTDMEVEKNMLTPSHVNWRPSNGEIEFANVNLRYRPALPLALKDVSFRIHPREKIGIVGRTGSGKSSLVVSLLRLVESSSGSIRVDGMDISHVPLDQLRRSISVIPQEPILFSGTVRTNLDPFQNYKDLDILKSLDRVHLHSKITSLDQEVSEGGLNFSIGERQLVCIARALLRKSKIILLDEATASIDVKTDELIQESMKNEFSECTCLTIAHRINTVMNSDRILVMDEGRLIDFDTVPKLLNRQGIFSKLVNEWKNGEYV